MALDEALLEFARQNSQDVLFNNSLFLRTYGWCEPTLSLGVHQPERDLIHLYNQTGYLSDKPVVRRPTGGRAILHSEDISFSFVTNAKIICDYRLTESYVFFNRFLKETLQALDISFQESPEKSPNRYLRSPLCFQTQTPFDLVSGSGEKISGSAQCRRDGAILQQGSVFLKPFSIDPEHFTDIFFSTIAQHYSTQYFDFELASFQTVFQSVLMRYCQRTGLKPAPTNLKIRQ